MACENLRNLSSGVIGRGTAGELGNVTEWPVRGGASRTLGLLYMTSQNVWIFVPLYSLSAFGTDLYYNIHTASLSASDFKRPLSPLCADVKYGCPL